MQTAGTSLPNKRARSPGLRIAIALIALWQALATVAPHPVSFSGASSDKPHFHATGDKLELNHDETACPVCTLQQTARTSGQAVRLPIAAVSAQRIVFVAHQSTSQNPSIHVYARGPPPLS